MNSYLLNRSLGSVSPRDFARFETERRLHALSPSSARFDHHVPQQTADENNETESNDALSGKQREPIAHPAGVNAITIDKFEGR